MFKNGRREERHTTTRRFSPIGIQRRSPRGKWELEPVRKSSPPVVGSITRNRGNEGGRGRYLVSRKWREINDTYVAPCPLLSTIPRRGCIANISSRAFVRLLAAGHNVNQRTRVLPSRSRGKLEREDVVYVSGRNTLSRWVTVPAVGESWPLGVVKIFSSRNVYFLFFFWMNVSSNESVFDWRLVYFYFFFFFEKLILVL